MWSKVHAYCCGHTLRLRTYILHTHLGAVHYSLHDSLFMGQNYPKYRRHGWGRERAKILVRRGHFCRVPDTNWDDFQNFLIKWGFVTNSETNFSLFTIIKSSTKWKFLFHSLSRIPIWLESPLLTSILARSLPNPRLLYLG